VIKVPGFEHDTKIGNKKGLLMKALFKIIFRN